MAPGTEDRRTHGWNRAAGGHHKAARWGDMAGSPCFLPRPPAPALGRPPAQPRPAGAATGHLRLPSAHVYCKVTAQRCCGRVTDDDSLAKQLQGLPGPQGRTEGPWGLRPAQALGTPAWSFSRPPCCTRLVRAASAQDGGLHRGEPPVSAAGTQGRPLRSSSPPGRRPAGGGSQVWPAATWTAPPETATGKLCPRPLEGTPGPFPSRSEAHRASWPQEGRGEEGPGRWAAPVPPTYLLEELPQHLLAVDGAPAGADTWVSLGPPLAPRPVHAPPG